MTTTQARTRELDTYILGGVQVVAAMNFYGDVLFDWAAYIGPYDWGKERIASHGCKLMAEQAVTFFSHLPIKKYRP
mgnify:FL=1